MAALPTFLIIGSQKAGTTWLHRAISQHPEVVVSTPKELHFFNDLATYERGLDWYADHFDPTPETKAIGEATPSFQTTDIPEDRPDEHRDLIPRRTHDAIPDARLVLILRDPVERAVSAYYHFLRKGTWPGWPSLTEVADSRGIVSAGFYDVHLARWLETFDPEQLLVFVYEEAFRDDASKSSMVHRTFEHIGVDPSFEPPLPEERLNSRMGLFELRTNQYPRLARGAIRRAVPRSVKERYDWGVGVAPHERTALRRLYEPHVDRLATMLGRSLPWPTVDTIDTADDGAGDDLAS
jgi:hypothetical protein